MIFANQYYLFGIDFMTPMLANTINIAPSIAYLVEQYNFNTSSIFPVVHVLYYINLIGCEINVIEAFDNNAVRSTLREMLFKAYIALNEHNLVEKRFKSTILGLIEEIISLIVGGVTTKLNNA